MTFTQILYTLNDDVAHISLNDPKTLNAMSETMGRELLAALRQAAFEARAVLITGEGRAFCSGANLTGNGDPSKRTYRDVGEPLDTIFNPIALAIKTMDAPVVTAVRGAAAGVGSAIAMCGDIIVCSDNAFFIQAFGKVGLVPDGGTSWLLSRAVGRVRAMEAMLLGEKVDAAKALDWGLVTRVVPDDELDATAFALAARLAKGPKSLGFIKRNAWAAEDATLENALANERQFQKLASQTDDFNEGVQAFREKRQPQFTGS